jgi:phosphoglycolate phosphatase-like HAD superfamily hydrolase
MDRQMETSEQTSEIVGQFQRLNGKFARAAVEAAIESSGERREEITLALLSVLEETVERAEEFAEDGEYMAHFYAMYLLAQFREARAYPLVVRLAQLPSDLLEDLCGDFVTETLGPVLTSVCDGDLTGLKEIIENADADEWARGEALSYLVSLVALGHKSREEIVEYFASLFGGKMERQKSFAWDELVSCSADLWPEELLGPIEQAYADGLLDEDVIALDDVRDDLAKGKDAVLAGLASNRHYRVVKDTLKEFGRWACFQPQRAQPDRRTTLGAPKPDSMLPAGFQPIWRAEPGKVDPAVAASIGRNDLCPCGSGKKYKKCCLQ